MSFDTSNIPAFQENQDQLFTRWRDLYKAGGIDLYTLQTKIGLPDVSPTYKERFFGQKPILFWRQHQTMRTISSSIRRTIMKLQRQSLDEVEQIPEELAQQDPSHVPALEAFRLEKRREDEEAS